MTEFLIKRIYEPARDDDGRRVLVDRLWPRGVSRQRAALDEWARELAPSADLRRWFGHVPERFDEFARRYEAELQSNPAFEQHRAEWGRHRRVTLLYGARDEKHNEAAVLCALLADR